MSNHIELNSAYPVNVGWRHVSVSKILEKSLEIRLIGIVGEEEIRVLPLNGELRLDGIIYRLISIHHKAFDNGRHARHIAGVLAVSG